MESFKNSLLAEGKSKSTVTHYTTYVLDFISWLDAENVEAENASSADVLGYMNHLQKKGLENKTRGIRLNVIKQFFYWQVTGGLRTDNPVAHLKIRGAHHQKLYYILSPKELQDIPSLYEVPTKDDSRSNRNWFENYKLARARNKVILSLMIHQGITTKELENLSVHDLKLKEGILHVQGSRSSNPRDLELKSMQMMELMEYHFSTRKELMTFQKDPTDKLFLATPGTGQNNSSSKALHIWKGLSKDLKDQHSVFVNFRQVRASVITQWLKSHNLRKVQYMAGHKYVSSTEAYFVNQTDGLKTNIDQFHPF